MSSLNLSNPIFHMDDPATGGPLTGGLVYTYVAGTSTALTTYSDSILSTPNSNPVVLNSYGDAPIWFDQSMKIVVRSADTLTTYYTFDNISPVGGTTTVTGNYNLVLNGSFESGSASAITNWTVAAYPGASVAITTASVSHGKQAVLFNGATAIGGGTITSSMFDVTATARILVSYDYYVSNATTTNAVQIFWFKKDDTASATVSTDVLNAASGHPTAWTQFSSLVTVPSDATRAQIKITGIASGGSNLDADAYFDNVFVLDDQIALPNTTTNTTTIGKLVGSASTGYTANFTYTGTTNDDYAVYGNTTQSSGNTVGVLGLSASATGKGVGGYATHATGINYGGYFSSASSAGFGVYAVTTVAGGVPLYASAIDVVGGDANSVLKLTKGAYQLLFNTRSSVSAYNPIVVAGDQTIVSAGAAGAIDTGVLTLAPYATDAVGIRIDSTVDTVTISGTTNIANAFQLGGVAVTSSAAELNILDGVTSSAAELNILDGVTASAAELNYNDITTLGTAQPSRVLTLDASSNLNGTVNSATTTTANITTANITTANVARLYGLTCAAGGTLIKRCVGNSTAPVTATAYTALDDYSNIFSNTVFSQVVIGTSLSTGTLRIQYTITGSGTTTYMRIVINGTSIFTDSNAGGVASTRTTDITVAPGDIIVLQSYSIAGGAGYMRNINVSAADYGVYLS